MIHMSASNYQHPAYTVMPYNPVRHAAVRGRLCPLVGVLSDSDCAAQSPSTCKSNDLEAVFQNFWQISLYNSLPLLHLTSTESPTFFFAVY